jgi:hypothetical protein
MAHGSTAVDVAGAESTADVRAAETARHVAGTSGAEVSAAPTAPTAEVGSTTAATSHVSAATPTTAATVTTTAPAATSAGKCDVRKADDTGCNQCRTQE